jgi:hypothetical protein
MAYEYKVGDRVIADGMEGEVVLVVPGNGRLSWYYVRFDDGSENKYIASWLRPAPNR